MASSSSLLIFTALPTVFTGNAISRLALSGRQAEAASISHASVSSLPPAFSSVPQTPHTARAYRSRASPDPPAARKSTAPCSSAAVARASQSVRAALAATKRTSTKNPADRRKSPDAIDTLPGDPRSNPADKESPPARSKAPASADLITTFTRLASLGSGPGRKCG